LDGLVANKQQTSSKNTWGLVRMDGTSKLQWRLKQEQKGDTGIKISPRLWRSDWQK